MKCNPTVAVTFFAYNKSSLNFFPSWIKRGEFVRKGRMEDGERPGWVIAIEFRIKKYY